MRQNDIGRLIKSINGLSEKNKNKLAAKIDLTAAQLDILSYLEDSDQCTFKDIENEFMIAQPTAAGLLKRLAAKGFIKAYTDGSDHRVKRVALTLKGREIMPHVHELIDLNEQKLTSTLNEKEITVLQNLLMKVRDQ